MWAARQVALGRGQDRATRVGCGHAHPTGLPARSASCAPRESRSRFGKVFRCFGTLGIWTGSRKLHLSLFFREPVGVFLPVLFCEAMIGLKGKAAELWGEDENENIDLFVCRDLCKLDEDKGLSILQVEVTSVS